VAEAGIPEGRGAADASGAGGRSEVDAAVLEAALAAAARFEGLFTDQKKRLKALESDKQLLSSRVLLWRDRAEAAEEKRPAKTSPSSVISATAEAAPAAAETHQVALRVESKNDNQRE